MNGTARREDGFTLIEILVVMVLLGIVTAAFYSVMLSGSRSSNTTEDVVRVSEEARLGLNRAVRDTREADLLACVRIEATDPACSDGLTTPAPLYVAYVDFDGNGEYENTPGNTEILVFSYNANINAIELNGQVLARGVEPIPGRQIFSYTSNHLEWDVNDDGVTTWQEVDSWGNPAIGNNNGRLDPPDLGNITSVHFAVRISEGRQTTDFFAEAQLRNRR